MKLEINKHKEHLISIYPVNLDGWTGKIFFKYLLKSYFTKGAFWAIDGRRPHYMDEVKYVLQSFEHEVDIGLNKPIHYNFDEFEPYYYAKVDIDLFDTDFEIIYKLWVSYEQGGVVILNTNQVLTEVELEKFSNYSWTQLADSYEAFILFKGIEDDVIWVGKSNSLQFITESETLDCIPSLY